MDASVVIAGVVAFAGAIALFLLFASMHVDSVRASAELEEGIRRVEEGEGGWDQWVKDVSREIDKVQLIDGAGISHLQQVLTSAELEVENMRRAFREELNARDEKRKKPALLRSVLSFFLGACVSVAITLFVHPL